MNGSGSVQPRNDDHRPPVNAVRHSLKETSFENRTEQLTKHDLSTLAAMARPIRGPDRGHRQVPGRYRVRAGRHDPDGQRQLPDARWATRWTRSRAGITACSSTDAYRRRARSTRSSGPGWAGASTWPASSTHRQGRPRGVDPGGVQSHPRPDGRPFKVVKYATDVTGQVKMRLEHAGASCNR